MAKRALECKEYNDRIEWVDASGSPRVAIMMDGIPANVVDFLLRYGVRQYIADGGAVEAGAPLSERVAGMASRVTAILAGTAGIRIPDAATFTAAVAVGRIPDDTPDARAKWSKLTPAQRAAVAGLPDVAAEIARRAPKTDEVDTDAILAGF